MSKNREAISERARELARSGASSRAENEVRNRANARAMNVEVVKACRRVSEDRDNRWAGSRMMVSGSRKGRWVHSDGQLKGRPGVNGRRRNSVTRRNGCGRLRTICQGASHRVRIRCPGRRGSLIFRIVRGLMLVARALRGVIDQAKSRGCAGGLR